ncbi:MAG TPA: ATP-binding protein, partial [Armatimonadota bacterium]
ARLLAVQAEDLAASRDQAQAASQAKSDFLANMSHEIRTPMNGVLGMADLLLETPLSTQQRSFAQTIQESARSLLDLLGGLLDLSKIEAGRLELESVEMDLRELLDSLLDLFALSAEAKGVTLACLVDPGVPNLVRGDPGRLRQILINLVGNALKFTDSGSVTVEVSVTETSLASVGLRFAVADTGIGIRPQQVEALFEAFTQADASTTRRFGGTGLGLTISRHLVDLMGGEIGAEGRPGQGSTFWFTLELPLAAPESPGRHPYAELEGVPVLVVSAEMLVRRSLELTLLGLGCQPAVVGTEADAIECLALAQSRGKPFRAVLLDEGSEREGRKGGPSLLSPGTPLAGAPVVLLTSLANQAAAPREASSGQAWTLSKPIRAHLTAGTLVAAVSGPGRAASTPTQEPVGLSLAGVRILLVEDNLINQQVARCMLERLGCASEVAANGQEALDLLSRERYDAVLMDCQMPEMDGYEASRALRAREAATGEHALVIAMTANAMHGDRERCLDAGMDDYISKPLETHRIRQVLSHWIASSRREAPVGDRPRATEPAQQSVFDLEGLTNRAGPEVELHRRLVSLFLRDVPGKAAALRQAIRDDRSSDAREAAHAIKGMAATLGAPGISRAAAGLEQALLQAPPSGLPELLESLEVEWQHFRSHDEVQRLVEG